MADAAETGRANQINQTNQINQASQTSHTHQVGQTGHGPAERGLQEALDVLHGRLTLPPRRRARVAALLARSALEVRLDGWLVAAGHPMDAASTRAKLICLRTLVDADLGRSATLTWNRLSEACHQHAYELAPNAAEIVELVHTVRSWPAATAT